MSGSNGSADMIHERRYATAAPAVQVRFRCEVVSTTREGVLDQFAEILGREGYFVSKKVVWEKTVDFRKRVGLAHDALHRILKLPVCPPVEVHRARNGKGPLLAINSNPVFEAFVAAAKGKTPDRIGPHPKYKRPSRRKPARLLKRARMAGPKRNYATV